MNRIQTIFSKTLVVALPLAALAIAAPAPAHAQDGPPPPPAPAPPPADVPPPPPDAYIATVQPEYYEGRPVYWYNGNWFFRGPGGWNYYHTEPGFLHDRRSHWNEHARYHYHR